MNNYRYEFSICMIFRNERCVLREWLDHHLLFGCQHFYLIDNGSTDASSLLVQPYVEKGLVDLVHDPRPYRQWFAYDEHFLPKIRNETKWIAVIDADEFLYPRHGGTLAETLRAREDIDALAVPWLLFGSNGHLAQPEQIVDSFLQRADYDQIGWTSFKTVVRTEALAAPPANHLLSWDASVMGIHSHRIKPGAVFKPSFQPEDTELLGGERPYCYYFREASVDSSSLVINHYRSMSFEYYCTIQCTRPSACTSAYDIAEGDTTYFRENDCNDRQDTTLASLTRTLRARSPASVRS
ncbi:glycosyltransferase family 2 protein [Desulfofustis glycolicus]|uniref:Glycosyltransferase family 92 n=1 Tax=Desulfofustis glycolicus DSM 9705 TaxID=1121409 RepID=A0A1M5TNL3_9BACT|nr:glycosyltransferase family 2 protein [Desulfofustis glycolicus]MCB2216506.1 glycosyltransferase family 2 protein [Desulfobulbaceae bacterium]SHH52226.1 Glycosyltransferase family 92 [Desulfofustis glycolicus DSM 9705]